MTSPILIAILPNNYIFSKLPDFVELRVILANINFEKNVF